MRSRSFLTLIVIPSLVFCAVIDRQGIPPPPTNIKSPSSIFGIDLFKGNTTGPCYDPSIEIALEKAYILNSTENYCISTHNIPTTCVGRRMVEQPGVATTAQTYEASHGGLDTKARKCNVIGYQKDGCPRDEGLVAQYHQANATWSWDHATRIRDNFPGRLWSVLSFQLSCSL